MSVFRISETRFIVDGVRFTESGTGDEFVSVSPKEERWVNETSATGHVISQKVVANTADWSITLMGLSGHNKKLSDLMALDTTFAISASLENGDVYSSQKARVQKQPEGKFGTKVGNSVWGIFAEDYTFTPHDSEATV